LRPASNEELLDDDENVAGADVNIVSFGLMGFVFTL